MTSAEVEQPHSQPVETIQLEELGKEGRLSLRTEPASKINVSVAPEEPEAPSQTPAQLRRERIRFAALLCSFFVMGWDGGSTGALLPAIKSYYNLGFAAVSSLFISTCLGAACGAFSLFYMLDRFGFGKVLVFGSVLQTLAYAVQTTAPPFPVFVIFSFFTGMGTSFQARFDRERFRALSCLRISSFADAEISLFSLFPALESLRVNQIVSGELDCLSDPPASMSDLSLGSLLGSPVYYAPLARIFQGLRLKALRLRRAHDAASVVELFADTTQEPWCMIVAGYYSDRIELREEAQHRVWLVSCDTRISFTREPRLAASLDQLGGLTCSTELLVQLHNLDGWTRSLPALRALTLRLLRTEDAYAITSPRTATPVRTPLLNSLTLWLADMTAQIKLVLEMRLPALIPAILERAPTVMVDVIDPDDLLLCDLEPLCGVAEGLLLLERRSGRTMVYSPRR